VGKTQKRWKNAKNRVGTGKNVNIFVYGW